MTTMGFLAFILSMPSAGPWLAHLGLLHLLVAALPVSLHFSCDASTLVGCRKKEPGTLEHPIQLACIGQVDWDLRIHGGRMCTRTDLGSLWFYQ